MNALLARFDKLERGSARGERLMGGAGGGILFGFSSLPVVLS